MPRYYFNVDDGVASRDDDGTELKDLATAKCEAVKMAGRLICEDAARIWDRSEWRMVVTDEGALTLFCLTFFGSDAPVCQRASRAVNLT